MIAGSDAPATDDHYKAQADAIDDTHDPFGDDYDELMEHPENAGSEAVCLVPTNLKSSIRGLADFHPVADGNIDRGSASDVLVGSLDIPLPGSVFGYHEAGVWLVEWPSMPSSYYAMVAAGASESPLKMRELPFTELQGFSEILRTRDLTEQRRDRYMEFIYEQSTKLGGLVDNLLDVARIQARRGLEISFESVDIEPIVQSVVEAYQESNLKHTFNLVNLDHLPKVMGDPLRLDQVVRNLVSNAVK